MKFIKKHQFLEDAVFIVGAGRSGTTLLQSLLDGHPELLVWPEEFPYFLLWRDFFGAKGQRARVFGAVIREKLIPLSGAKDFGKMHNAGRVSKPYSMENVDERVFLEELKKYDEFQVSRKEYLQLTMLAFFKASIHQWKPKAFVVKVLWPHDEMLEDFPEAKIIFSARRPISIYNSTKEYYFKIFHESPWEAYFRAGRNRLPGGLIATSIQPVLYVYEWINKRNIMSNKQIFVSKLEDLQVHPKKELKRLARFLDINYGENLLHPSMLGIRYKGNLSSDPNKSKEIIHQQSKLEDLTDYEKNWALKQTNEIEKLFDYEKLIYNEAANLPWNTFIKFFLPLKNEIPNISSVMSRKADKKIVRIIKIFRSFGHYFVNRMIFLLVGTPIDKWVRKRVFKLFD